MESQTDSVLLAISVIASVGNVVLVILLWVALLRRPVHVEKVGNVTLKLVVVAVMPYSVVGLIFIFNLMVTGEEVLRGAVCQVSGVFLMLSLLLSPAAAVIRYMYFMWFVVLQRRIHPWRWLAGSAVVVSVLLAVAVVPGILGEYSPRDSVMQCTIQYHTHEFWPMFFGVILAVVILAGLLAHILFNGLILSKLQLVCVPKFELPQNSRAALLRKFFPVALAYLMTHSAPLILALVELISKAPASLRMLHFYSISYAITTFVYPLATIVANKSLTHDIKDIFHIN
ncbi:hypothetical protein DSO57_1008334 [Entomophthora muscae]|uniref:Uncharacterized protein n=1 Tax=Entomophthora muscae TaxID=34485 RepID=A0ACC2S8Y4_9FUNG|nr:hypothetical protein DSO57_1008334 [Entomophthora muscae]